MPLTERSLPLSERAADRIRAAIRGAKTMAGLRKALEAAAPRYTSTVRLERALEPLFKHRPRLGYAVAEWNASLDTWPRLANLDALVMLEQTDCFEVSLQYDPERGQPNCVRMLRELASYLEKRFGETPIDGGGDLPEGWRKGHWQVRRDV